MNKKLQIIWNNFLSNLLHCRIESYRRDFFDTLAIEVKVKNYNMEHSFT
jgi:hypothetical protein